MNMVCPVDKEVVVFIIVVFRYVWYVCESGGVSACFIPRVPLGAPQRRIAVRMDTSSPPQRRYHAPQRRSVRLYRKVAVVLQFGGGMRKCPSINLHRF